MARRAKPGEGANPKAAKYRGDYAARSKRIRDAAYSDRFTRCWRPECRRTLAEARAKWGRQVIWHAGHLDLRGDELAAECSHCNIAERNARMRGKPLGKRKAGTLSPSKRRTPATTISW